MPKIIGIIGTRQRDLVEESFLRVSVLDYVLKGVIDLQ